MNGAQWWRICQLDVAEDQQNFDQEKRQEAAAGSTASEAAGTGTAEAAAAAAVA